MREVRRKENGKIKAKKKIREKEHRISKYV